MAPMSHLVLRLALAGLLGVTGAGRGTAQTSPPDRNRDLLALMRRFLDHPADRRVWQAVFDSASARRDMTVELSSTITPWICYQDSSRSVRTMDSVLTIAFIVGSAMPQLEDGRKRDRPRAGLRAVLRVYPLVQEASPGYLVPEVDRWRQWARAEPLDRLADSLASAPGRDCPDPMPRRYGGRVKIRSIPDSAR